MGNGFPLYCRVVEACRASELGNGSSREGTTCVVDFRLNVEPIARALKVIANGAVLLSLLLAIDGQYQLNQKASLRMPFQ